jgi:PAS domain S-box-containing protein
LGIQTDNPAQSLSVDREEGIPLTPSGKKESSSFLVRIMPRHILLVIAAAALLVGIVALLSTPRSAFFTPLMAIGTSIAGGVVIAAILIRSCAPTIERIVEAQKARAALAEEQYRSIFENSVEGIFQTTVDGRYLKANRKLAEIYGYNTPQELMDALTNIEHQLYVNPDRRREFAALLDAQNVVWGFESQVRKKNGEVIWIRENARTIRDEKGKQIGYEGTVLDISQRIHSQQEVIEARERQRTNANHIQQTLLLGQPPEGLNWLDISAYTLPSHSIDGDFFDFYRYSDNCLDVLVGDVMGKGVAAALLGAGIKSSYLRAVGKLMYLEGANNLPSPENIVSNMHARLTKQFINLEVFATMCCLRFEHLRNVVTYVDCGHTKTLHCSAEGVCRKLESDCVPLGVSENEVYIQREVKYNPGDVFLSYSDGITEAMNPLGEQFGSQQLEQLLIENRSASSSFILSIIRQAVLHYCDGEPLRDDLTAVVIVVK